MERWSADFVNNPNEDYNLMVEILYDEEEIAVVKKRRERPFDHEMVSDGKGIADPRGLAHQAACGGKGTVVIVSQIIRDGKGAYQK